MIGILHPIYDAILNTRSQKSFSLYLYISRRRSKALHFFLIFFSWCLFYNICILCNSSGDNFAFICSPLFYSSPMYLLLAMVLTIVCVSPYSIFFFTFILLTLLFGDTFSTPNTSLTPLYFLHAVSMSCYNIKTSELHHPGFFIGKMLPSTRIIVIDMSGRAKTFQFAPFATVFDLKLQINHKWNSLKECYWLSCKGKTLLDHIPLDSISGIVVMNGRLFVGV